MKTYSIKLKGRNIKTFSQYLKEVALAYPLYNRAEYLPKIFNEFKKTKRYKV